MHQCWLLQVPCCPLSVAWITPVAAGQFRLMMTSALKASGSSVAISLFKALSDPNRLKIIEALAHDELCVCELMTDLGLAQSRLSFHLKVLKQCGLVMDRQSGRWVYYRLQPQVIKQLQHFLGEIMISPPVRTKKELSCCDE